MIALPVHRPVDTDMDEINARELRRLGRLPTKRVRTRGRMEPNVRIHPDGRIQISSGAVLALWPANPRGGESYPGPLRVALYARGSDELVIAPAAENDPEAFVASPVGRREIRWPVVYVVRAAQFMRELGIYGVARYRAHPVPLRMPDGQRLRAIRVPLREPIEGRRDDVLVCLREWKAQAQPGEPVKRDEFLKQLAEVARRLGTVITRRQLEDYVRSHKNQIRQLGIRFVLSGKTTFQEVLVEE